MRVRILYTNGAKTNDAFWLNHDGKNVYLGNPGVDHKISYHESGQLHVKSKGQKQDELKHVPLAKVVGKYNLLTSLFPNSEWQFDDFPPKKQYRGGKSDAVLVIDSRSIPTGALVVVSIGVVEAGRLDALIPMTIAHDEIGVEAKQILLATNVAPWVYVILYWGTEEEFNDRYQPGGLQGAV
ncbi:MAG TPA: hypothetical protein VHE60_00635 [Pyrinomonadaceae bacterium]|nr:hypothetical protein [Pyrinomonadaceae bacterium]